MNRISKKFGKKIILDDISFELSQCDFLIGENGSGKTTLLKILAGLIKKFDGNIDTENESSLLLDSPCLYSLKTGFENLEFFLDDEELKNSKKYIELFQMNSYINTIVKKYSNGMKKKLSLVIALSKNKKVLLLDEPTNSLDNQSVEILKKVLYEEKKNKKIVIASHDMKAYDEKLFNSIFLLKKGRIYKIDVKVLSYTYYKAKTIRNIDSEKFYFKLYDNYHYFKVFNKDIEAFSDWIAQYKVFEISKVDFCEPIYMEDIYND